jgi:glycerophosphoryl diester phosphodiesterase
MTNTTLDSIYQGKTLVFGHRGAKAYAPMNTLPAFELAAQQGADGVELDVQFSRDRQLVVIHDFTVDGTTDGEGHVRDISLSQLKALDAGSWFGSAFSDTCIPTLEEVFEAVGNRLFINVEIKVESRTSESIEEAVADLVIRRGLQQRVIVSSFDLPVLEGLRRIAPDIAIGFLHFNSLNDAERSGLGDLQFEAVHPYHALVDAAYVEWARANGYRVNTWTVNEPERALELRDLGVDALITDNPDVILSALGHMS